MSDPAKPAPSEEVKPEEETVKDDDAKQTEAAESDPDIEDAEVLETTDPDYATDAEEAEVGAAEEADEDADRDADPDEADDSEDTLTEEELELQDDEATLDDGGEDVEQVEETVEETIEPEPAPPPVEEQKSGFFGTFFTAIIAALVVFGGGYFAIQQGRLPLGTQTPDFSAEFARITELQQEVADLRDAPAPTPPPAEPDPRVDALVAEVDRLAALAEDQAAALNAVIGDIEELSNRPVGTGAPVDDAQAARLQAELEAQRAETARIQAEIAAVAESARAEIAAAEARASALESETQDALTTASMQTAFARLTGAVDSGTPFDGALADIASLGLTVPAELQQVATSGVPTLADLQQSFPPLARDALAVSRRETMGTSATDRVTAFLQAQVGARSLDAREGTDPDAVLSRAEAALRIGDLPGALAEISALPSGGQAVLASWVAQAQARAQTENALQDLSAAMNQN